MTKRGYDYYVFIRHFIYKEGFSPTHSEIAAALNVPSRGTVKRNLDHLVKDGWLNIESKRKSRNIRLIDDSVMANRLPMEFNTFTPDDIVRAKTALANVSKIVKDDKKHYLSLCKNILEMYCNN